MLGTVPARVLRSAVVLRPSTILDFHRMLRRRKYRWLFAPRRRRTGPKGNEISELHDSRRLSFWFVELRNREVRWCGSLPQLVCHNFNPVHHAQEIFSRELAQILIAPSTLN